MQHKQTSATTTTNDTSGIRIRPAFWRIQFLFLQHFLLRKQTAPPFTVSNLLTWMIETIAAGGMFDKTNCLVVVFTQAFAQALNGITTIHSYDLYHLIVDQIVDSYFTYPFTVLPSTQKPQMWDCKRCRVPSIYRQYIGHLSFDYVHHRRQPMGSLARFIYTFVSQKSAKKGLTVLRMYRILIKYSNINRLQFPGSYRNSIYISDQNLFQIFGVASFHTIDLPYLILQHSRPFEKRNGRLNHVC